MASQSASTQDSIGINGGTGSQSLPVENSTVDESRQMEETKQQDVIEHKGKKRSPWWDFYDVVVVNKATKAKCKACNKVLGGESRNGTTHLKEHYHRCPCRRVGGDIRQMVLKGNSKGDLSHGSFNNGEARLALAKMVIIHEYPLSIVEHRGFRDFTVTLQPLFKCPSRNTLKSDVMKVYAEEKCKVIHLLEECDCRVAITTDVWTSSNQKRGFMAITAHFIDNSWVLRSQILRFIYVPCPHTSEVLTEVLIEAMMEWNLDSRLSTITVDNCSINDSMIGKLKTKLNTTHLVKDGSLFHMRCSAHILNLVVKIGLDEIKDFIENVRDSVVYWTASPKRVEKFEEVCRGMKVPCSKKLGLDCPTRWNSTYLMLKVALHYKNVFPRLKLRESQYKTVPLESE
ncbi:unnamed protein product [Cuscuta europaea]|uniref:BED-type domain-containing protein n=1 Tax=Cuscuta europaea TaxID=41803 RepID=A0A9P0Z7R8_CUSEU|nr:unnamed protein product [Cuscuta europaea]